MWIFYFDFFIKYPCLKYSIFVIIIKKYRMRKFCLVLFGLFICIDGVNAALRTQNTSTPSTSTSTPAPKPASTPAPAASTGGSKTARIRYVVPPVGQPMNLRIEVTDPSGKRDIMNRQVKGGESINTSASYSGECMVSIYLGGQSVWQERYK